MNILAVIGLLRSPLGRLGAGLFAALFVGFILYSSGVRDGGAQMLAKVEAVQAAFEAEIAIIKADAEQLGADLTIQLDVKEKELADALAEIDAAGAAGDDGSGGITGAASMRLNSIR
jgi:hypothetical protein